MKCIIFPRLNAWSVVGMVINDIGGSMEVFSGETYVLYSVFLNGNLS